MSKITQGYKHKRNVLRLLSILLLIVPILVYAIIGFSRGEIGEKFTMGMCLLISFIFVLINALFKANIRSTLWILLIGIHICIDNITTLLFIMAITTMLDEFLVTPLAKHYAQKYTINVEIDKRG